ncbi:conjugal transfer relaxosome DNA-binding protein TraM [Enterobacter huaxiensis]|uniref:conjugal transfer relaxosome DNA-binding protein TraM n=1 Tax=Enterobacter huaxiensis TaxID=2494702 RepID=UPI00217599F3|nr:conjugal transfer relaxosome DNA-binding protein TraM [Enterobacter huaxiensis]MCS5452324.1 relaxosome protein TraM [Enterobacter huaxiensis]
MPKIQVYMNHAALEKIEGIVNEKRQGGASIQEANVSNTSSMLIELGLRVYMMQLERGKSGFNLAEFNRTMLEHTIKTNCIANELLLMTTSNILSFKDFEDLKNKIRSRTHDEIVRFFPDAGSEEDE